MRPSDSNDRRIAKYLKEGRTCCGRIDMPSGRPADILKAAATFALGVVIVLLIWESVAWYINDYKDIVMKFPAPADSLIWVWDRISGGTHIFGYTIAQHVEASLRRLVTAFGLATAVGVSAGAVLGYYTRLYSVGIVPVTVFQTIPGLAWVPIAILLFGLGDDSAVFIIFSVSCMVITINVAGGIRMVPETVVRAAGMMGAGGLVIFSKVLIPYSAVDILNGLRLGMGSAWRVLIAAEMLIGSGIGLGYSLEHLRYNLDFIGAFGCIILICMIGLIVDKVVFTSMEKYMRHRLGMEEGY